MEAKSGRAARYTPPPRRAPIEARRILILLFAVLATAITASAYDFEVDGIYYNYVSQEDLTCEVTSNGFYPHSYSGDVVIPSTVTYSGKTYSVTSIGQSAFESCSNLKEITSLAVTPPKIYNYTFEGVSKTETVVKVPDESVDTYKAADYWKSFWNIVALSGEGDDEPETKQCAAPTIEIVDGKLVATSATEGATCYTSITSNDFKGVDGNEPIELSGVYNITSYAHAEGYQNSETVTATVVWVNPTIEGSSVMSMEAKKAVLIRAQEGSIIVSGTERGEGIQLYSIEGTLLCNASTDDGETVVPCAPGKGGIVVVKYGGKSVKVLM